MGIFLYLIDIQMINMNMRKYESFLCAVAVVAFFLLYVFPAKADTPSSSNSVAAQWMTERQNAVNAFVELEANNHYCEQLSIADMNNLPMGISRHINNIEYTIAISSVKELADHLELTVYGRVKIPQSVNGEPGVKDLFFAAQDIKFSFDGSLIGDARLVLLGDVTIPLQGDRAAVVLHGSMDWNTGRGLDLTYLSMDCSGFKELSVDAAVIFSEELIRRVNESGEPVAGIGADNQPLGRVAASFRTVVRDWTDLLVTLDFPRFEIVGLDGFIFNVNHAVFDYSEFRNDPEILFPNDYPSKYMLPGNLSLWKGVYIRDFSVSLPKQFSSKGGKRVSFSAQNLILDDNGISGLFSAHNVLAFENGSAGGWRFSVDQFSLSLEANKLTGAGFKGIIGLPVAESTALGYEAFISPNNEYLLRVNSAGTLNFDLFAAKATMLPNSYVELKVVGDKFYPEAMLNGSMAIVAGMGKPGEGSTIAEFKGIEFRQLHLMSVAPFITVDYLGYSGEVKLMNFPLSINNIAMSVNNREARLGLDAKLSLGDSKFAITAATRLEIIGEMKDSEGLQSWQYKTIDVSKIAVNASFAEVFTISGGLTLLNNDPVYGDGFAGDLRLTMDKVLTGLAIETKAVFGYKDFRYWFVDGKIGLPGNGIPVLGPVCLQGFSGGAYYKMKSSGLSSTAGYIPEKNRGLGLKAGVMFNTNKKVMNGEASFEIAFNSNGGLDFIGLYGMAKVLSEINVAGNLADRLTKKYNDIQKTENEFTKGNDSTMVKTLTKYKLYEPNKAAAIVFPQPDHAVDGFIATLGIQYDFTNSSLHACFEMFVNMMGGMLRGVNSENSAGQAVLHVDPHEWYLHIGTPDRRLGIMFDLAGLVRMETGAYFMVGDNIPASPPPPRQVADILGVELQKLDYMRDLNALGNSRGFAFGANFLVSTGDITFIILYANFQAGLGFDIMLKDYGDAQCKGRNGSIGMNGWYANGQAYAFLQGELGVKINLLFINMKIPVISGAAAALMQAKLPNPSWFAGYLGVKLDILGGLISASMRMKIALGEECELVLPGGNPLGVKVINDLTPEDKAEKVDVFAVPQAAFNMPIDKMYELEDDKGIKYYKLKLEDFSVYENGKALEGKIRWNTNKDAASFYTHEILPPNVPIKAVVVITFEEYQNGRWVTVYSAGKKAEERKEISFTTGTAPDIIPLHNIEYSYPVFDQQNFFLQESPNAYVQLKRGQSYLFAPDTRQAMLLTKEGEQPQEYPFIYNNAKNRIEYTMPALARRSKYNFDLLTFAKGESLKTQDTRQRINVGDEENEITVRNAQAGQEIREDIGKSLLAYDFATSRYGNFTEKMKAFVKKEPFVHKYASDVINLQYEISGGEPFDVVELIGNTYSADKPLVQVTATLDDNYYKDAIYPLIYEGYEHLGFTIKNRNASVLGVPPLRAVPVNTQYLTEVENGILAGLAQTRFPYIYDLPRIYKNDFVDLRGQIVNRYLSDAPDNMLRFFTGRYPFIPYGYYKIILEYRLPGELSGTKIPFEYFNFMK